MARVLRGIAWTVGIVVAAGLIGRATLFDVWTVPADPVLGASLAPTLGSGDVVLLFKREIPGFGTLARCKDPDDATKFVAGRVGGVEGDTVETQGPLLVVNHHRYDPQISCPTPQITVNHPRTGAPVTLQCDIVDMAGGWHYRATHAGGGSMDPSGSRVVPEGSLFLVSDDRDMHDDSRDFGPLKKESCQHIVFRLWGSGGWRDGERRMTYVR